MNHISLNQKKLESLIIFGQKQKKMILVRWKRSQSQEVSKSQLSLQHLTLVQSLVQLIYCSAHLVKSTQICPKILQEVQLFARNSNCSKIPYFIIEAEVLNEVVVVLSQLYHMCPNYRNLANRKNQCHIHQDPRL